MEKYNIPEENSLDSMEGVEKLKNKKETIEVRRKRLYDESIEREHSYEEIETTDIFRTPLLFRQEKSIIPYLEFERLGGTVTPSGETLNKLLGEKIPSDLKIYLEAPIPLPVGGCGELIMKKFPQIQKEDLEKIGRVVDIINLSRYEGYIDDEEIQKSKEIISDWLNDPNFKELWLWVQEGFIKNGSGPLGWATRSDYIGENGRQGSFLISPNVDKLTIARGQTHYDYAFELLHLGRIKRDEIVGYLVADEDAMKDEKRFWGRIGHNKDHLLNDALETEVSKIFGHLNALKRIHVQLFPYENPKGKYTSDFIMHGLIKYIKDKFKIEVNNKTTVNELMIAVVKEMKIPIYDFKGNQVWPQQMSHEEIVKMKELEG